MNGDSQSEPTREELIALIKASQGQWYKIPIVGDLAASFSGNQQ